MIKGLHAIYNFSYLLNMPAIVYKLQTKKKEFILLTSPNKKKDVMFFVFFRESQHMT